MKSPWQTTDSINVTQAADKVMPVYQVSENLENPVSECISHFISTLNDFSKLVQQQQLFLQMRCSGDFETSNCGCYFYIN